MHTAEDLRAFYDSTLKSRMDALEHRRRTAVNGSLTATAGLVIAGLIIGIAMASSGGAVFMVLPIAAGGLIGAAVFKIATAGYRAAFKSTVVGSVIAFLEPGLRYDPERGISKEQFRAADLFRQRIDRYRSEDLVQGRIGQTDILFSEVHAQYKTTSHTGKTTQTHWHTIFKGVFFMADFHKHFRGRLLVLPDTAQKLFGEFGQSLQALNFTRGALIKLEDPEFEREFVVYGDDQVEARYILSPSMMERISAFRRKCGSPVHLSFLGSRVIVAFSVDQDMFEPTLLGPADFETIRLYAAQLRLVTSIVDDLNLNTRIWSKA